MTVDELKSKIEILTELNERLKQRVAEAGLPTLEHHWENKAREHLAEVHALRSKCAILESEQNLKGLRKDLAKLENIVAKSRDQRARDIALMNALRSREVLTAQWLIQARVALSEGKPAEALRVLDRAIEAIP